MSSDVMKYIAKLKIKKEVGLLLISRRKVFGGGIKYSIPIYFLLHNELSQHLF
jgi:hypothetical protein